MNGSEIIDVAIVGAGLVGPSAKWRLGYYGIRAQLFEKRTCYVQHYRGPYFHSATAKLARRWGKHWHTRRIASGDSTGSMGWSFAHSIAREPIATFQKTTMEGYLLNFWAEVLPKPRATYCWCLGGGLGAQHRMPSIDHHGASFERLLNGNVAIITGAGRGIAAHVAERCAQLGALLVLTACTRSELEENHCCMKRIRNLDPAGIGGRPVPFFGEQGSIRPSH